jgi:hypothetical protein
MGNLKSLSSNPEKEWFVLQLTMQGVLGSPLGVTWISRIKE